MLVKSSLTGKKPTPNNIANSLQPIIANPLPIDSTHRAIDVPHDVVEGYLILGFAAYRLARSAQAIEAPAFDVEIGIDAQLPKAFRYLAVRRIGIAPGVALPGHE